MKIHILGEEYPLQGGGDESIVRQIEAEIDGRLREIGDARPGMTDRRKLVLLVINLTSELLAARRDLEGAEEHLQAVIRQNEELRAAQRELRHAVRESVQRAIGLIDRSGG